MVRCPELDEYSYVMKTALLSEWLMSLASAFSSASGRYFHDPTSLLGLPCSHAFLLLPGGHRCSFQPRTFALSTTSCKGLCAAYNPPLTKTVGSHPCSVCISNFLLFVVDSCPYGIRCWHRTHLPTVWTGPFRLEDIKEFQPMLSKHVRYCP